MGLDERPEHHGLAAREQAVEILHRVFSGKQFFDTPSEADKALDTRDRGFAVALAATVLRRDGELNFILKQYLTKPLPHSAGRLRLMLKIGLAQLLFMATPPHAAINQTVEMAKRDNNAKHFSGLVNAVLRRASVEGAVLLATVADQHLNMPNWLWRTLSKAYGNETATAIADAHLSEAALDLSVKSDPALWAEKLDGKALSSGTIRLNSKSPSIPERAGFAEGAWWVQDAASALPVKLLGDVAGLNVLDLCAAPGGKTAQFAAGHAHVTAVDSSADRMTRLSENLARLNLTAHTIVADVLELPVEREYDVVLLDAPCSATGTLRRHPDLTHLKTTEHIGDLVALQWTMLHHAALHVRPGGTLLYCTCSLLPTEGEKQVSAFLKKHPEFVTKPWSSADAFGLEHMLTPEGWLRTHPAMAIGDDQGLDGFFAARLQKQ